MPRTVAFVIGIVEYPETSFIGTCAKLRHGEPKRNIFGIAPAADLGFIGFGTVSPTNERGDCAHNRRKYWWYAADHGLTIETMVMGLSFSATDCATCANRRDADRESDVVIAHFYAGRFARLVTRTRHRNPIAETGGADADCASGRAGDRCR